MFNNQLSTFNFLNLIFIFSFEVDLSSQDLSRKLETPKYPNLTTFSPHKNLRTFWKSCATLLCRYDFLIPRHWSPMLLLST